MGLATVVLASVTQIFIKNKQQVTSFVCMCYLLDANQVWQALLDFQTTSQK